jgi:hypothetical protein
MRLTSIPPMGHRISRGSLFRSRFGSRLSSNTRSMARPQRCVAYSAADLSYLALALRATRSALFRCLRSRRRSIECMLSLPVRTASRVHVDSKVRIFWSQLLLQRDRLLLILPTLQKSLEWAAQLSKEFCNRHSLTTRFRPCSAGV